MARLRIGYIGSRSLSVLNAPFFEYPLLYFHPSLVSYCFNKSLGDCVLLRVTM
jgi:hypothetical protein